MYKGYTITLEKTLKTLYSLYLHKSRFDFDCTKYSYSVPKTMETPLMRFYEQNQFVLPHYIQFSENNCIIRGVVNFFINNENSIKRVKEEEYDKFVNDLVNYKNNISLYVNNIGYNKLNPDDIFTMYIKKQIPWYLFYFSFRFLKFSSSNNMLINDKLKHTHKILLLFKHFDIEYAEEQFKTLQHRLDLMQ